MATRLDQYRMADGRTPLAADYFNPIWADLDRRMDVLERIRIDWLNAVADLQTQGLLRIDSAMTPLLAQLQENAAAVIATLEGIFDVATAAQGELAETALQPADIGDSVQAQNVNLAALAALSGQANRLAYFTGAGALALTVLTEAARTLLAAGDQQAQRTALGLTIGAQVQGYSSALDAWAAKARPSGDVVGTTDPQTLSAKTLQGTKETVYTITDKALVDINPANGGIQTWTLLASRTPTASNFAAGQSVLLMIADGSAYAVTWTTIGVVWVGGSAPALATSGYTCVELWKVGSTVYGAHVGDVA